MKHSELVILQELGKGLPMVREPFSAVGARIGLTGDEVLANVRQLKDRKVIRKFRARINQRQVGIIANALVAWKVPKADIERVGTLIASFSEVSHVIERGAVPGRWEYSLYTVHHGWTREAVVEDIRRIAGLAGGWEYRILFSTAEFKRAPSVSIPGPGGDQR